MIRDETTFFLAFASVFLGIVGYLWHLHRIGAALQERLDAVTTTAKNDNDDDQP